MASEVDNCPNCGTSFIGGPIPKELIESGHYGEATHWRREIGIDGGRIGVYDGVVAFMCPECKHEFPRGDAQIWQEMFMKYKDMIEKMGREND